MIFRQVTSVPILALTAFRQFFLSILNVAKAILFMFIFISILLLFILYFGGGIDKKILSIYSSSRYRAKFFKKYNYR